MTVENRQERAFVRKYSEINASFHLKSKIFPKTESRRPPTSRRSPLSGVGYVRRTDSILRSGSLSRAGEIEAAGYVSIKSRNRVQKTIDNNANIIRQ